MKAKLTLSVERALIEAIKDYADERDKSVSQLVSEYFSALTKRRQMTAGRPGRDRPFSPAVQQLIGAGKGSEEDYYAYLEEKHR